MDLPDGMSLLRQYARDRRGKRENGKIFVGHWMLNGRDTTNLRSQSNDFFTMETLFFFIQYMDLPYSEYYKACSKENLPRVPRVMTTKLKQYLNGDVPTVDFLDVSFQVPLAQPADTSPKVKSQHQRESKKKLIEAAPETFIDSSDDSSKKRAKTLGDEGLPLRETRSHPSSNEKDGSARVGTHTDRKILTACAPVKISKSTQNIIKNELIFDTRTTILCAKGKDFSNVLSIVKNASTSNDRQKDRNSPEKSKQIKEYSRFHQPASQQDSTLSNIDLTGSNYQPGTIYQKLEQPPTTNSNQKNTENNKSTKTPKKRTSRTPIIIVPSGMTAKVTLLNVKKFLEEGNYVASEKVAASYRSQPQDVYIQRKRPGGTVQYHLIDNVAKLNVEDWRRVVAVIVAGPKWQFKHFPDPSPVTIFSKYRGFYFKFMGEKAHPNVRQWNCKILEISQAQRHLDSTVAHEFWKILDGWTLNRYQNLNL